MPFVTYLSSIALGTPVAKAILLVYFHQVFGILLSCLFLAEPIAVRTIVVAVLAVIGVLFILEIWHIDFSSITTIAGDLFALTNAFFYASYIVLGRYLGI
jgi:drug/metabolite transporter (DMT)-like permease